MRVRAPLEIVLCSLDELPADPLVLDALERRRAGRLQSELDRRRFVAAHTLLRRELGERLAIPPGALEFSREPCSQCGGPHGRTIVVAPGGCATDSADLHFSLSHSAGQALLAISESPVGADVETLPDASMCRHLTALLHPRERSSILGAPAEAQRTLFTQLWCRKEAYLKALGVGLAHESTEGYLASIELTPGWRVENIETPEGFAAAVATAVDGQP